MSFAAPPPVEAPRKSAARVSRRVIALGAVAAVVAGAGGGLAVARTAASTPSAVDASGVSWDALPASLGVLATGSDNVYSRNILPGLALAKNLGAVTADQPMTVDLAIAHPHAAAETAMANAIYDAKSPDFHHYLTPQSYAALFGIPAETTDAAKAWATAHGLSIESVSGAGDIVQLTGAAPAVAGAFGVTLANFSSQGKTFIANTTVPTLPAALHVQTVVGLNTVQAAVPDKVNFTATTRTASAATVTATRAAVTGKAGTTAGGPSPAIGPAGDDGPFTPQDMWSIYDLPDSNRGSGASAGVFMEGATAPLVSDLRRYEERTKLPQVPVRVVTEGKAGTQTDNLGADEWDLDTDAITGLAPDISSLSYYDAATFGDADLLPDFANWRDDANGPLQMNASFGECEEVPQASAIAAGLPTNNLPFGLGLGDTTEPMYETVLQAAAMEGRTLFASAGDTAASCPAVVLPGVGALNGLNDEGVPIANYPSASKWAISVGGTDIETTDSSLQTRLLEYGEPTAGGGSSLAISQQPWMAASQTTAQPCAIDETGAAYPLGTLCRGMPDVSALYGGQVAAGYDTMTNHQIGSGGGTSLASPLSVGMWTRIQAAAPSAAGLGFASPVFYKYGAVEDSDATPDFYDVTVGFNNNAATPGWDRDTGFGVIDDKNLMMDAAGGVTPTRPAGQLAVPAPTADACEPLFTTYSGNANDALDLTATNDPSLDITGGDIRDSADGKAIVVSLTGPALSSTLDSNLVPFGADDNLFFEVGSQLYYAKAAIAAVSGTVTYTAGAITGNLGDVAGDTAGTAAVTGTFVTGKLTMTVPLSDIGNPTTGTRIKYPLALAESQELGPVFGAIGIDAGTDQDYVIGDKCNGVISTTSPISNGATTGTLPFAPSSVPAAPVSPKAPVTAAPTPISAGPAPSAPCTAVRGSTVKVYGNTKAKPNRHGQVLYTFKLFVNLGKCKTPSPVGRQFIVFVDGRKSAVLRTGKNGVQTYLVRLKPGMHAITASFPGNRDLKKSASAKFHTYEV